MGKISLDQFIEKTIGTRVDVKWGEGKLLGECVSLMQQYLGQCFNIEQHARGDAKDWKDSLIAEGVGQIVEIPQRGDIIVFYDPYYGGGYGHIAIYIDQNTMYDQNNEYHDNGLAGYCNLNYTGNDFKWGYVYIRPITQPDPIPEPTPAPVPAPQPEPAPQKQILVLPAHIDTWRVYPMGVQPVVGNECGFLLPSKFGGLEYEIQGWSMDNVAIITTRDFGQVQIYVGSDTPAQFKMV